MPDIDCPHKDATQFTSVCCHLLADKDDKLDYGWHFTGVGRDFNIICPECARHPETKDGAPTAYLFRCLHRGRFGGYTDTD